MVIKFLEVVVKEIRKIEIEDGFMFYVVKEIIEMFYGDLVKEEV